MKTQTPKLRFALYGVPLAFLLVSASAFSHDVIGVDGKPTHQHVYKRDAYGNARVAGHAANPAGGRGIVIWQSAPSQSYARPQTGMQVPTNPFSKNDPKRDQKSMYNQKPAFSKNQDRTPDIKPQ
jgi:hypothetical protein